MKRWFPLAVLIWTPTLALGGTLRCSERIIDQGATRAEVASLCGDPTQVEQKTIYNDVSGPVSSVIARTTSEIHVEMWIYNFGPNQLMQRIWFQDGILVRIESMGYGF